MRPTTVQLGKASSGVIFVKQKAQKKQRAVAFNRCVRE
jgi:hypothetical protein